MTDTATPPSTPVSFPSDLAFTPSVKAIQSRLGSRAAYARREELGGWKAELTPDCADFIQRQTSVFFGTASKTCQPYIQHRGGPPGFLRVLDNTTIAFADYAGNRQYITTGNLADNDQAFLFLLDYSSGERIKLWGKATVSEDPRLMASLMSGQDGEVAPDNAQVRAERTILFHVRLWDRNCRQHIPQRFDAADVEQVLRARDERISALEAEVARLRSADHPSLP